MMLAKNNKNMSKLVKNCVGNTTRLLFSEDVHQLSFSPFSQYIKKVEYIEVTNHLPPPLECSAIRLANVILEPQLVGLGF